MLVHHDVDVRIDLVAAAVAEGLDAFPAYVAAVARIVGEADPDDHGS